MNKALQNQAKKLPGDPGCYLFLDQNEKVLYVGKAKNLRSRTLQYFGHDKRFQLPFLLSESTKIQAIITSSELEALFLENTLIKKYDPKYNIKLKDDKFYAFIKIDYSTQIPQITWSRKTEQDMPIKEKVITGKRAGLNPQLHQTKNYFFGPYSSTQKIKHILETTRKVFHYCGNKEIGNRPCFYYHLRRCPGICVGKMSLTDYNEHLADIKLFLQGKTEKLKNELKKTMLLEAKRKKFERAASLRDQLKALETLAEKQSVQFTQKVDWDFWSEAKNDKTACLNLLKIREGKLTDSENFIVQAGASGTESNSSVNQVLQTFLEKYYADTYDLPTEIFTQKKPSNQSLLEKLLKKQKGVKCKISTPKKGVKQNLINLSLTNAQDSLRKYLQNKTSDSHKTQEALARLAQILKLSKPLKRIECYDISNIQGSDPVGSMVVFLNGLPAKAEYRKFKIRTKNTPDDFAMMNEMLSRRLSRISNFESLNPKQAPNHKSKIKNSKTYNLPTYQLTTSAPWPRPDLIVIDGGKGQLNAVLKALRNSQLQISNFQTKPQAKIANSETYHSTTLQPYHSTTIPIIGLAKRIEEIFLPGQSKPIVLSHDDPTLQILQRIRDEAHRFAITFHRSLRSKRAVKSRLDEIPGVGAKTKKLLKDKFGTVEEIKKVSEKELAEVVGEKLGRVIKSQLG